MAPSQPPYLKPTLTVAGSALLSILVGAGALLASSSVDVPKKVTYSEHVAQVLDQNCISCHRSGDIAPMSLRSYEEVRPWAKSIRKAVVKERTMPPWHASPEHGVFKNDRSLDEQEIALIDRWVKQGAKEGDPALRPESPAVSEGWRLGEPDLVVRFDEVSLPGGGPDVFRDLSTKMDMGDGKWLRAVEVKPGNREVVHHVILFAAEGEGQPESGWLGAWAAGMDPMQFPEGTAKWVGPDSFLVADMHYHPAADPSTDTTEIGLYFYEGEPEKELINLWVANAGFKIPAGAEKHIVRSSHTFQEDGYIHGLLPHMHYRGKKFSYTATYPDGTKQTLLKVDDYDFNWQTLYELDEPAFMPEGTRLDCVAQYDNSANNPDNPDPTRDVTFGDESYDEMMIGFVDYVVKDGLRPMSNEDKIRTRLAGMLEQETEGLWWLTVREEDDQAIQGTLLKLNQDGSDGLWLLPINNTLMEMAVTNLKRDGDQVTADITSPFGKLQLEGTLSEDRFVGKVIVPFDDESVVFEGRPATAEDARLRGGVSSGQTASQ